MKQTHVHLLLLILMGFSVGACAMTRATFEPAVTIVLAPDTAIAVSSEDLEAARLVVQRRLDEVFADSSRVTVDGSGLRVELSSAIADPSSAANLAKEVGIIEFWASAAPAEPGTAVPTDLMLVMNGLDVSRAQAKLGESGNAWQIMVEFTPEGTEKLAQFTTSSVGQYLILSKDGEVVIAPRIEEPIREGEAVISAKLSEMDARGLAAVMNSGALRVPLKVASMQ